LQLQAASDGVDQFAALHDREGRRTVRRTSTARIGDRAVGPTESAANLRVPALGAR